MATYKILALFALLALSASATSAITTMQYFMDPYNQYMIQYLGMGSSAAMFMPLPMVSLQQQCCMQLRGMISQCHCGANCQMMQNIGLGQQQMMMNMATQLSYMCNMAPINFQVSPFGCC
uniref:Bifunctional inhibitor/plant lipid transfer protein/seed storage helical domain-containing protein n=1 Tax=Leersia perrieri TaxID=77586 RepID=A0A0D9VZF5_9ORYZ